MKSLRRWIGLGIFPLLLACSSGSLTPSDGDSPTADDETQPSEHETEMNARHCSECMNSTCSEPYQRCLPKDPNSCANLNVCIKRCTVASCAYDCGGHWAVSPEATEFYSCVSDGCEACFPGATDTSHGTCMACLQTCHGLPDCCAGPGCLCEGAC